MLRIANIFLLILILILIGCAEKERESLEKYSDIITVADLREVISYPGMIEEAVTQGPEGVHITFYIEGGSLKKEKTKEILSVHIEYLISSERDLMKEMSTSEPLTGIADYAWYDDFKNGSADLIFYIADKKLLVGIEGYTKFSDMPPSTFIDKDGFIRLAHLIEKRLR
jgi:hypothetical protein